MCDMLNIARSHCALPHTVYHCARCLLGTVHLPRSGWQEPGAFLCACRERFGAMRFSCSAANNALAWIPRLHGRGKVKWLFPPHIFALCSHLPHFKSASVILITYIKFKVSFTRIKHEADRMLSPHPANEPRRCLNDPAV